MTEKELDLRRRIMLAFAETGEPPSLAGEDPHTIRALVDQHVIVLDADGATVRMAHPFANHDDGVTVTAQDGRSWRGSCAWDAYGIAAALELDDYALSEEGELFHIAVPAARWWDDIAFT